MKEDAWNETSTQVAEGQSRKQSGAGERSDLEPRSSRPKADSEGEYGAAEGTRTPDPIITNDVLYHLSYSGLFWVCQTSRDPRGDSERPECAANYRSLTSDASAD